MAKKLSESPWKPVKITTVVYTDAIRVIEYTNGRIWSVDAGGREAYQCYDLDEAKQKAVGLARSSGLPANFVKYDEDGREIILEKLT